MNEETAMRPDGRAPDEIRPVTIEPNFLEQPHGCALIAFGDTKVLCTAMIEDGVPQFMMNQGRGWVTAEYDMLPASTVGRKHRNWRRGKADGRALEIQRLIGRALRGVIDQKALGERTIWLDCDVIQADGGTRTAAVTGAWVALALGVRRLRENGTLKKDPILGHVAAISAGVVHGRPVLDLCYEEDAQADTDLNLVMGEGGGIIEIQGTAERAPFSGEDLDAMVALGRGAMDTLFACQRRALSGESGA